MVSLETLILLVFSVDHPDSRDVSNLVCLCVGLRPIHQSVPVSVHNVCVFADGSWLESSSSLRWAAADILVCFKPLANKTAGNHQKNASSWTGVGKGRVRGRKEEW